MRVLLCLASATGGIGTHVADLTGQLLRAGHEVQVATDASTRERFALPGQEPLRVDAVRRLARDADVVHAHGFRAGLVVTLAGARAPFVLSLHNPIRGPGASPRRILGEVAARLVMRRARLVTGASDDLVEDARSLGARAACTAQVPSPRVPALLATDRADWRAEHREHWLTRHGLRGDLPLVLTIARVAPQKGIDLLRGAAEAAPASTRWALLGPGQEGLETAGRLHLLGESTAVSAWLLAADVLLVPSEWEARALVVQEAMAAGTPVVARRVGGLPDLLDGLVPMVPDGGQDLPERLAEAVTGLLADPAGSSRAATRARSRAAGWAGVEESARRWALRYESVRS